MLFHWLQGRETREDREEKATLGHRAATRISTLHEIAFAVTALL